MLDDNLIRPKIEPFDQTPVAILTMTLAKGTSAFADDNPTEIAGKFAKHLQRRNLAGLDAARKIGAIFADLAQKNPRQIEQRISRNMSFLDRMKALREMPSDLSECFGDGESATIASRSNFKAMAKARGNDQAKTVLDRQLQSHSKKIQYAQIAIPKAAGLLAETLYYEIEEINEHVVFEIGTEENDYLHILSAKERPALIYRKASKRLSKSPYPFTLGAKAMMLTPTAWAIIRAIGYYGFALSGVETGNAACAARKNTKPLRQLRKCWANAVETIAYHPDGGPLGFEEEAAVPFEPSSKVMAEIQAYTEAVWPRKWHADQTRGIAGIIAECLRQKKRRT